MSMSFGQKKAIGHSHGGVGHGGLHHIAGPSSGSNSHMSNPHVNGSNAGHTMSHEHGGSLPMGC